MNDISPLSLLWEQLRRRIWMFMGVCAASVLLVVSELSGPLLVRALVDEVTSAASDLNGRTLAYFAMAAVAIYFGRGLFNALVGYGTSYLGYAAQADIRRRLYVHLQALSPAQLGAQRLGGITTHATADVNQIQPLVSDWLPDLAINAFILVGGTAILTWINPWLTLITMVPFVLLFFVYRRFGRSFRGAAALAVEKNAEIGALVAENVRHMEVIQSFAQETREIARFDQANDAYRQAALRAQRIFLSRYPFVEVLGNVGLVAVIIAGGLMVQRDALALADLIAFYLYAGWFFRPLSGLVKVLEAVQRSFASLDRVAALLALRPMVAAPDNPCAPLWQRPRISFRNVHFAYPDRPPLFRGLDLDIEAGEQIALVGHSGAGKSTLARMLLRFFDPRDGAVLVNDQDIREVDLQTLRQHIAYVPQDPSLHDGTIADNIAYGLENKNPDVIRQAASDAGALDFIEKLPQGFDTRVGEAGALLSSGQKQRIALARALVKDAAILILDEPTSAVDQLTEHEIAKVLQSRAQRCTTLVIAHHLSTVEHADRIVVVDHGSIVEQGAHAELLARKGHYHRMYHIDRRAA